MQSVKRRTGQAAKSETTKCRTISSAMQKEQGFARKVVILELLLLVISVKPAHVVTSIKQSLY